jgi:hypothetical protein
MRPTCRHRQHDPEWRIRPPEKPAGVWISTRRPDVIRRLAREGGRLVQWSAGIACREFPDRSMHWARSWVDRTCAVLGETEVVVE